MKRLLLICTLLAAGLFLAGCNGWVIGFGNTQGSGKPVTEKRDVGDFTNIVLDGIGKMTITQGDKTELEIEAEDNVLREIETEVRGDTLYIGFRDHSWRNVVIPTRTIEYRLQIPKLNQLEINGAASASAGEIKTDDLTLQINGTGEIVVHTLTAENLAVIFNGSGSLDLGGKVNEQRVTISGLGDYNAARLESNEAIINVSGAGNATMWVTDSLDATLTGAGKIEYYGEPDITKTITGVGKISGLGNP